MKSHTHFILALVVVLAVAPAAFATTDTITLTDGQSTAYVDPTTSAGMYHWDIQGQNELNQQWFWYRIGDTSGEQPINAISAPSTNKISDGIAQITYDNGALGVTIQFSLTANANRVAAESSTWADMGEQITLVNHTASPVNLHFFQYSNFDLGAPGNDTAELLQFANHPGKFGGALQSDASNSLSESVAEVSPWANEGDVGVYPNTINSLTDASPTTLSNTLGPVGPGDVTWALEWDLTLAANGGSIGISKDKSLSVVLLPGGGNVPEPSTIALLACGATGLLLRRRRA